jgi:ubiquinone/menaquinone biosynthesis C-methylase UbiE
MNAFATIPEAFDEIAGRYDTTGALFTATIAARLVDLAALIDGENVLDIGCGTGAVTVRAAQAVAPGGHVTGIDLSPRMLQRAAAAAEAEGVSGRVTLRPGDATRPHAPAAFYNAVLSSLVLYLLPDPAAALTAWLRLLAPNGLLGFSWSLAQDPRWLRVFHDIEQHNTAPGFLSYTGRLPQAGGMETVLREIGYHQPTIITETVTTVYDSPEQFWASSLSQGPWVSWRNMPPGQLEQAKAAALRLLESMREGDGTLTRHTRIGYATAYAPAAA